MANKCVFVHFLWLIVWMGTGVNLLNAQDAPPDTGGDLDPENIDIVKPYEPVLEDAVKVVFNPDLPTKEELEQARPDFNDYIVPSRYLLLQYDPQPLKPLSYKNKKKKEPYGDKVNNIWLRAGFGNLLTPILDVAVSSGKSEKFVIGANGSHISSRGTFDYQDFSRTDVNAFGKVFMRNNYLKTNVNYARNTFFYYGYHADTLNIEAPIDETAAKQTYQNIGLSAEFGNSVETETQADYQFTFDINRYFDAFDAGENNVIVGGYYNKFAGDNVTIGGVFNVDYTNYNDTSTFNNTAINITPQIAYRPFYGVFTGGISAMIEGDGVYVYPYIDALLHAVPEKLDIYAGLKKELIKNNLQTLSTQNPFIAQFQAFDNTLREERYLGAKGSVGPFFTFNLKAAQTISEQQPLFVNDVNDYKKFVVVYDSSMVTWSGIIELGYDISNRLNIGTKASYNNYETSTVEEAWHLPTFTASVNTRYALTQQLILGADLFVLTGIKAQQFDGSIDNTNNIIDLNLSAKYQLNENIGFFFNANNIAGVRGERFLNYPSYGINVLGGAIIRF